MAHLFNIRNCWLICLTILWTGVCVGQSYGIRNYHLKHGLKSAQIVRIEQDHAGVLWVSTNGGGIAKFDGLNFTPLTVADGLSNNTTFCVVETENYDKLVGTEAGLSIVKKDTIIHLDESHGIPGNQIWDIVHKSDSSYFLLTNRGFCILSGEEVLPQALNEKFKSDLIRGMVVDTQNRDWLATAHGLFVHDEGEVELAFSSDELNQTEYNGIMRAKNGDIWASTLGKGVVVFKGGDLDNYRFINADNGVKSLLTRFVYEDSQGNIWFGTMGGGLCMLSPEQLKEDQPMVSTIYPGPAAVGYWAMKEDVEGNLWVGSYGGGLYQMYRKNYNLYQKGSGLKDNFIWAVTEDSKNNLWIGTNAGGLTLLTKEDHGSIDIKDFTTLTAASGLPSDRVHAFLELPNGRMLVGTSEGVCEMEYNGSFKIFHVISREEGLTNLFIRSLFYDEEKDRLLVGTQGGLYVFTTKNNAYTFHSFVGKEEGLPGEMVYDIELVGDRYYLAMNGGLAEISRADLSLSKSYSTDNGMVNNDLRSIRYEEKHNNLLLASAAGFSIMSLTDYTFDHLTVHDGLQSDRLYFVCRDDSFAWLGSNMGVEKFNYERYVETGEFESEFMSSQHGFLQIETNTNAVEMDHAGDLWVGTIDGVAKYFLTANHDINRRPPVVSLLKLYVNSERYDVMRGSNEFNYDENNIEFHFLGLSLTNPEGVEYQYKLAGHVENWSNPTKENRVLLNNLGHGKYTLYIKAQNSNGVWSDEEAVYSFEIHPPFWLTSWFITLALVALGLLIWGLFRYRLKKSEDQRKLLEAQVRVATRELIDEKNLVVAMNQEISEQNASIAEKNVHITDSLDYAQRIQMAILPPSYYISKYFPDSFVFYTPKDIVAGDFYWLEESGDEVLIAVADCTGHGVPGALVSVVCHNALNRAVREFNLTDPGDILTKVSSLVVETFARSESDVRDGMDIALCAINKTTNKLRFAGANNPMWLINKKGFQDYKGSSRPVGKSDVKDAFTTNEITYEPGDTIYLTSDGYLDQFGGKKKKKFKARKLKSLLIDICKKDLCDQQKDVQEAFETWKGDLEQVDDVCVIGLRL